MSVKSLLVAGLVGAFALLACGIAGAQNWPTRPPTLVVPFAAGGTTDLIARPLAQNLAERLGQSVIVDNRAGAGGTIGAAAAAKSPADGYTMFLATTAHTIAPGLYRNLSYDLARDFDPITIIGEVPNVLIVNPKVAATTATELVAYIRANPGKVNYGSAGPGSVEHLSGALFRSARGRRHRPRPLQGRRADDDRPDRRPYPNGRGDQRLGIAAHQGGRRARPRRQHQGAVAVFPGAADAR